MNEHPQWTTVEGATRYKAHVSRHHVAFERRSYKTRLETLYRNMGGMVVLLDSQVHRELHTEVAPPPKPNHHLMADIYQHARLSDYESQYDVFKQIVDYVGMVAAGGQCEQNVEDAALLHANLLEQAHFVDLGQLTRFKDVA